MMEDFHNAGGVMAAMSVLRDLIEDNLTVWPVAGRTGGRRGDLGR